ncbi:MAG: exodeoxyribonuclease VII small subunit [Bacteroidaceae bacterium]|nr:exodeoxyribonuclease VII small subunit [Bacteroidaceae bacterium]
MTYEQSMNRIEQIVRQIESGNMNVDDLATNLKEAQQLIKNCKDRLTQVEEDVKKAIGDGE